MSLITKVKCSVYIHFMLRSHIEILSESVILGHEPPSNHVIVLLVFRSDGYGYYGTANLKLAPCSLIFSVHFFSDTYFQV